jgi:hypothetical protein
VPDRAQVHYGLHAAHLVTQPIKAIDVTRTVLGTVYGHALCAADHAHAMSMGDGPRDCGTTYVARPTGDEHVDVGPLCYLWPRLGAAATFRR